MDQYIDIKKKHRVIAMFKPDDGIIPAYMKDDTELILLQNSLTICE